MPITPKTGSLFHAETQFVAWQAGSFLPFSSFTSQNASIIDPYMRKADDLTSALKYRIPLLRETLMPKRDALYGEPVENPGYHTFMRQGAVNTDPIKAELARLKYFPAAPEKQIGGVKLSSDQYDKFEATAGPLVKEMLSQAIRSPGYQQAPMGAQHDYLKAVVSGARAKAAGAMQMAYPQLIQQGVQQRQDYIGGASSTMRPKQPPKVGVTP